MRPHPALLAALALAAAPSGLAASAPGRPATPFVRVFDTGTSSGGPLTAQGIALRKGWQAVAEGDAEHRFVGDAAVLNDRVAIVLRRRGDGAEIHAWADDGPKLRVAIAPVSADASPRGARVRLVEHRASAVTVEVARAGAATSFRLTTGEMTVEVRPGDGVRAVRVAGRIRHVVVPEHFADDAVYGLDRSLVRVGGLPAENVVLNLLGEGDCIAMCVWESPRRSARIIPSGACEIECGKGERLWVGLLDHPGIWHARPISDGERGKDIVLDWRPPFPAAWRASVASPDGFSRSGPLSGTAISAGGGPRGARLCVVYPLDRSRETPLNVFCPTDVLRGTLGVGPCQYILDLEGLPADASPTPEEVARWVRQQVERKRAGRRATQIAERLGQMAAHVGRVEGRLAMYAAFAERARQGAEAAGPAEGASFPLALGALAKHLADCARLPADAGSKTAARLAADIARLTKAEPSAKTTAQCIAACEALRALGLRLDRALASSRMAVRRVRQLCLTAEASETSAGSAKAMRAQAEGLLWPERADKH